MKTPFTNLFNNLQKRICRESGAKIVISSTWRYNHDLDFWYPLFGENIHPDFKTPHLDTRRESGIYLSKTRGDEIDAWLSVHPEVSKYLILDDDSDMKDCQMPFLIKTDGIDGMLAEHMIKIMDFFEIKSFPNWDEIYQKDLKD